MPRNETSGLPPHEVIMPALGMAQDSGVIVAWHKALGEAVAADDVLFEVETDKATMEVPAGAEGFVTHIGAEAGAEVPVGEVIALIGASTDAGQGGESTGSAPSVTPEPVPEGDNVIMPALGMAQDSGVIVAWHKAPGEQVAAGDVLFEVETDKSTMEVEAGFDGYVAALLAEAGEEAPVGETIAVIVAEKPGTPVQKSRGAVPAAKVEPTEKSPSPAPAKAKSNAPAQTSPPASRTGRILASPKARRLALEQGLDLTRLARAGHPQPYHVADLEVLRALPAASAEAAPAASRRLTAEIPADGFADFAAWAADSAGLTDPAALLAGMAAASLGKPGAIVAVERLGATRSYVTAAGPLSGVSEAPPDAVPDLRLRDLRLSRISSLALGAEDAPVLTLTPSGDGHVVTLECTGDQLGAADAVALVSEFAGRMEQPLRHLL